MGDRPVEVGFRTAPGRANGSVFMDQLGRRVRQPRDGCGIAGNDRIHEFEETGMGRSGSRPLRHCIASSIQRPMI
jgi:hypothetical protein